MQVSVMPTGFKGGTGSMIAGIGLIVTGLLLLLWYRRQARKYAGLLGVFGEFWSELIDLVIEGDLFGKPVLIGILLIIIGVVVLVNST